MVGNIPVEKDKLHRVAKYLDIWSWTRCKILVGILLGPQYILILRDDIILQISSFFVAVIMTESLSFVDKIFRRICLKTWFLAEQSQQLMWKSYLKYFIDTRDLIQ